MQVREGIIWTYRIVQKPGGRGWKFLFFTEEIFLFFQRKSIFFKAIFEKNFYFKENFVIFQGNFLFFQRKFSNFSKKFCNFSRKFFIFKEDFFIFSKKIFYFFKEKFFIFQKKKNFYLPKIGLVLGGGGQKFFYVNYPISTKYPFPKFMQN